MSEYQIADLEKLTGIKAHTIRIWEKRYNLIEPHRTPTNIRYYDDNQVKKLLNTATLLAKGMKISKISALTDKEINTLIHDTNGPEDEDALVVGFINDLTASMLVFDEVAFDKSLSAAINRYGMYHAIKKTGLLWTISEAMPIQEHFASCIIRKKLLSAIDGLPAPTHKKKKFMLFLTPNEWHELGLMFSDYIIKSNGYQTIYLGSHVPVENLNSAMASAKPTHALTFFITRLETDDFIELTKEIQQQIPGISLVIGGSNNHHVIKGGKNIIFINSPDDLIKLLN